MAIKIFIDQGHNPSTNGGAEGFGLIEQDVTYNVGKYLADLLRSDYRFDVRVSRSNIEQVLGSNQSTALIQRVNMANSWGANYFISIHCNANNNPAVNGTEVYVYRKDTQAYYLAENVLNSIVKNVKTKNNGVRVNSSLYVLRRTEMPAILVELAYLSNSSDAQKLRDDQYDFAYAIYLGILDYFGYMVV